MTRGIMFLVAATVLWSGNYICGRYLAGEISPVMLNTIRWGISTVFLFILLFMTKRKIRLFRNWKEFLITGFYGMFAFSALNYLSLNFIHASVAGMFSAFSPVAILLFTPLVLKEKVPALARAGTVISAAGVIILFLGKSRDPLEGSFFGGFFMLLACLAWGLYTVYGKKYGTNIDPLTMTAGAAFYGTVLSAVFTIGTGSFYVPELSPSAWLAVLYASTLASVGAFFFWNFGVNIAGAGRSAPFINLLPVWTVLLGMILLNEKVTLMTWTGGIITISGAVLASMAKETDRELKKNLSETL